MNTRHGIGRQAGFALIEVLISLGLCALLAATVAAVVSFAARADEFAALDADAALLVQSIYAAQRLRPDDLFDAPAGWRIELTRGIEAAADGPPTSWRQVEAFARGDTSPRFTLLLLDESP